LSAIEVVGYDNEPGTNPVAISAKQSIYIVTDDVGPDDALKKSQSRAVVPNGRCSDWENPGLPNR